MVIDLWSRAVIGWSMSSRMTAQLACDALQMALHCGGVNARKMSSYKQIVAGNTVQWIIRLC
ncbi:hypothetical protein TH59_01475 [Pantoea ananatis]|nr:hypothetical protein [Pantoea ananatis]